MEIDKYFHIYGTKDKILCEEAEKPEQRWIPVSERLPDKKGKYLCTVHYAISPYHMFHPELDTYVDEISIQEFEEAKDGNVAFIDSVVSWMPLPEPYREE